MIENSIKYVIEHLAKDSVYLTELAGLHKLLKEHGY